MLPPAAMSKSNELLPSVDGIDLINYVDESQLEDVMRLVGQDLSEPYSSKWETTSFVLFMSRVTLQCTEPYPTSVLSFIRSIHLSIFSTQMAAAMYPSCPC